MRIFKYDPSNYIKIHLFRFPTIVLQHPTNFFAEHFKMSRSSSIKGSRLVECGMIACTRENGLLSRFFYDEIFAQEWISSSQSLTMHWHARRPPPEPYKTERRHTESAVDQ